MPASELHVPTKESSLRAPTPILDQQHHHTPAKTQALTRPLSEQSPLELSPADPTRATRGQGRLEKRGTRTSSPTPSADAHQPAWHGMAHPTQNPRSAATPSHATFTACAFRCLVSSGIFGPSTFSTFSPFWGRARRHERFTRRLGRTDHRLAPGPRRRGLGLGVAWCAGCIGLAARHVKDKVWARVVTELHELRDLVAARPHKLYAHAGVVQVCHTETAGAVSCRRPESAFWAARRTKVCVVEVRVEHEARAPHLGVHVDHCATMWGLSSVR